MNERGLRNVDLQIAKKGVGQPLVYQNAAVLRVVSELDHIVFAVFARDQVRLRSSAHFSYQVAGADRH